MTRVGGGCLEVKSSIPTVTRDFQLFGTFCQNHWNYHLTIFPSLYFPLLRESINDHICVLTSLTHCLSLQYKIQGPPNKIESISIISRNGSWHNFQNVWLWHYVLVSPLLPSSHAALSRAPRPPAWLLGDVPLTCQKPLCWLFLGLVPLKQRTNWFTGTWKTLLFRVKCTTKRKSICHSEVSLILIKGPHF